MDHSIECPHCSSDVDISHEKTLLLRTLLNYGAIHRDSYHYLIDELGLPEPRKQSHERAEKLLKQIQAVKEEVRETQDQEEERKDLEAKLEALEQEFKTCLELPGR